MLVKPTSKIGCSLVSDYVGFVARSIPGTAQCLRVGDARPMRLLEGALKAVERAAVAYSC